MEKTKYKVVANSLRLRSGPSLKHKILLNMPKGSEVIGLNTNYINNGNITWVNVVFNNTKGWTAKRFLTKIRQKEQVSHNSE